MKFAVITEVNDSDLVPMVNLYYMTGIHIPPDMRDAVEKAPIDFMSRFRIQLWVKSEIVILGDDGREIAGRRRDPSVWRCKYKVFDTLEEAIERAKEVNESMRYD
jgi:hypothetical protein